MSLHDFLIGLGGAAAVMAVQPARPVISRGERMFMAALCVACAIVVVVIE